MKSFPTGISLSLTAWLLATALVLSWQQAALAQAGAAEVTPKVQQLYAEANAASQSGDETGAIEKYRAIIKLAPHLAAAYNNLGALLFNQRDYAHAAEALKRGLELNSNMPTASAILGMSYVQLGENEKAEPLIRK